MRSACASRNFRRLLAATRCALGVQIGSVVIAPAMLQCATLPHSLRDRNRVIRESAEFDVVIVGAGPAGLTAACRLGQLTSETGASLSVCVVEKGSEVGSHIVSGAVIEPRALDELFPDWRERGAPVQVPVRDDRFAWLVNDRKALEIPHALIPVPLRNHGNYIVSVGRLCRWLARQAEDLGCDILPGFAATEILYAGGRVAGVATGDKGIDSSGRPKPSAEPGTELRAKYVIFAEGCRGNLGQELEAKFELRNGVDPQHYGLAFKEIWEIDSAAHRPGAVHHTLGWPLANDVEGGGFIYHADENRVSVGFVVGLNYRNPHLDPFAEFQRWKRHPRVRAEIDGGRRIAYAARAVNKGGFSSLPKLTFPGGLLVGCDAGLLNGAKIKGTHTAMKSGMLAAEAVFEAISSGEPGGSELESYARTLGASWVIDELRRARNFSAGIAKFGTFGGGALAFVEHNVLRGRTPVTLNNRAPDYAGMLSAEAATRIAYPPPDGAVSFDRPSSVYLSNTRHAEDQPCHLRLSDAALPIAANLPRFDEPAQRYCPAGVYEIVTGAGGAPEFRINAANCIHCKTCEIKDPAQNITWLPPEGGSGPNYGDL
jgi:electron-transferring-flavoprotein dehydrogenase